MKRFSIIAGVIALMSGCASTAGPFITNLSSDGNGNLEVERCMVRLDRMINTGDNAECRSSTIRVNQ
jgi:hypothetical protein